ncbi:MAG: glutamine--fructose-6-phosphate transaminase (isomerizing), partial [Paludibacteraceae bacterium]|nr:glutamine--fructose-6-phosphate transaminase (isomerizing) [Paludibacteraceae bacterium]
MCGIVGYIGKRQAYQVLIKGLHRLEYRGYDSAGVAIISSDRRLNVYKAPGKVAALEDAAQNRDLNGHIGIAHTRWATHGEPNFLNAHPHLSQSGRLAIVHNGIIENYASMREELVAQGKVFKSETDTEVLVQYIEYMQDKDNLTLSEAVQQVLQNVIGSYAIAVLDTNNPNTLVAARKGSPLVVGVGSDELFIGSDASPIIEYTNRVIYLDDEDMVVLNVDSKPHITLTDIYGVAKTPDIQTVTMDVSQLEKGGYDHFMLKEICEQPQSLRSCLQGLRQTFFVQDANELLDLFKNTKRVIITACGTSWHAGLVAKYAFEQLAHIPVEVDYASEFRYRNPVICHEDIVIAISQSGETADTLAAINMAKDRGAEVLSICNVIGSSIPRASDRVIYTMAGPEIGVASTKAFTAQVTTLTMLAIIIGRRNGKLDEKKYNHLLQQLDIIPDLIQQVLDQKEQIKHLA